MTVAPEIIEVILAAAAEAAAALPSAAPLTLGTPVTDLTRIPMPQDAAVAVVANFTGGVRGSSLVIVGADLVEALSSSPLGQLDVTAAVRAGLVAGAESLGQVVVEAGVELPIDVALEALAGAGAAVAVPLMDGDEVAVVYAAAIAGAPMPPQRSTSGSSGAGGRGGDRAAGLELLRDVEMEVTAELGRTRMTVRELLSLTPGAVVELDRAAGSPADLLVNGTLIARGEVVVVDEEYGIRITELVGPGSEESR